MERTIRHALIRDIASRAGTAKQLSRRYDMPPTELRDFVEANRPAIEAMAERLTQPEEAPPSADLTPQQLDDLWISKKFERLRRMQEVADETYNGIMQGTFVGGADLAMAVRELRSYMMLAANELGQLLHRGAGDSGDSSVLSVEITGVDMDNLR